jgi:hypothetical protein
MYDKRILILIFIVFVALALLYDYVDRDDDTSHPLFFDAAVQVRTELYFGLSGPGGMQVSPMDWRDFLDAEISTRFPDGITILGAQGMWQTGNPESPIDWEDTRLVIIVHPNDRISNQKISEIIELYRQQFQQQSVLRVSELASVSY